MGESATKQIVVINKGTEDAVIPSGSISGTGFTLSGASFPLILQPGASVTLDVKFTPTTTGTTSGSLTLTPNGSSAITVALSGTGQGTSTSAAPSSAGSLSSVSCASGTMTGAGTDACTVQLTSAAGSGGLVVSLKSSNSSVSIPSSVTVASGASSASFTATVSAVSTAQSVMLTATAGGITKSYDLSLSASADVPELKLSTTSMNFGTVAVGASSTLAVTLTSSGTAALTVQSGAISGTGFTLSGASFPLVLQPGASATLDVKFAPAAAGATSGSLTLTPSGLSAITVALSGAGQGTPYSVDLNWQEPSGSSSPITGYYVYRAVNGSSSYVLLTSTPVTSLSYTDTTVQSGDSYTYYATSVDSQGVQSVPSNLFNAAIP